MLASSGATYPSEIFIWKGGKTANPLQRDAGRLNRSEGHGFTTATYFNAVENWFVQIEGSTSGQGASGPGSSPVSVRPATRLPEGGDVVKFMALPNDPYNGLTGGPWPKNPCLWGGRGFSGGGAGNTGYKWIGAVGLTTNHYTGLASVIVEESYGRTAGNLGRGWRLGLIGGYGTSNEFDGLTASKDGVVWDGLYLGTTRFYNDQQKHGTYLQRMDKGGFKTQGEGVYQSTSDRQEVILGGTAGSITKAPRLMPFDSSPTAIGQNIYKLTSINAFTAVIPTTTMGSSIPGLQSYTRDISITPSVGDIETDASVIFAAGATRDSGGVKVLFNCGIKNELNIERRFAGTPLEGLSAGAAMVENSKNSNKVIIGRDPDTGQATRRSVNKIVLGDGDAQAFGITSGANLEIHCGLTVANLDMRSGSLHLSDSLFKDEHISVVKGSMHGGELNYYSLLSPDTRLRIGTGGNTFDDGIRVFSPDAVFRFSPNTYVKAAQGLSGGEGTPDAQGFNRTSPNSGTFTTSKSALSKSIDDKMFED